MRMVSSKALFLPVLLSVFLLSPALAAAQSFDFTSTLWVGTFGFEPSWLNEPRELILNAIIPFIAIYIIFLGLLRTLGIFRAVSEGLEHAISLLVAASALFTGGIGYVSGALSVLGSFSFIIFFILFIIGAILYSYGFSKKHWALTKISHAYSRDTSHINNEIKAVNEEIEKLTNDIGLEKNEGKEEKLRNKRAKLVLRRGHLLEQRRRMDTALRDAAV